MQFLRDLNPVTLTEAIRQILLVLVLFEVVRWTDQQIAGLLMAVSAVLALFARSATISVNKLDQRVEERVAQRDAGLPGPAGTPRISAWFLVPFLAGAMTLSACAARSDGTKLSPEGTFALRGTAVVNAIGAAAPAIEALTLPNSCGTQACLTAEEGLAVAKTVRAGLEHAKQLPTVLTIVDNASSAGEQEEGMRKAAAIVREVARSLSAASVPPALEEGRLKVVAILEAATLALLALGGF